ncbi:carboxymuconolactone decarboxylase family protein [Undibacterium sp. TS12]|uniref:carboxymuconolactone decarboxylase family protein n=1 Tax=Undibacterium sp. TS12 TaxID=2908202 RepID=UPI001F4CBB3E|nr:carboxymuconolactone decarboxylase family protein [Undibacterium sp. TS12]MCH8620359.1 carboxymuconolactone decarboxylase family protein [Undibacterium sp. TS12]
MSTSRIAPLEPPYAPEIEQAFQRIMPPGMAPLKLFRTQAHNSRVLQRVFAGNLLDKGSISLRERELVILRTCARCGSEYEWGVHVALFAARAGLTQADIAATLLPDPGRTELPDREIILLRAVDELHDTSGITDASWQGLAQHYDQTQILEIITLCGSYHTISFVTNAARVELEDFAPRFAQYR